MSFLHSQVGPLLDHEEGMLPAGQLPNPDGNAGERGPVLPASLQKSWQNKKGVTEAARGAVLAVYCVFA